MEANNLSSLFGWKNMANVAPTKVPSNYHLFKPIKSSSSKVNVCYDGSQSTLFASKAAFDGKVFNEIYAEALYYLQSQLPNHDVLCWSSQGVQLSGEQLTKFYNCINNRIPFANQIDGVNKG